jgi:hypothetical protein
MLLLQSRVAERMGRTVESYLSKIPDKFRFPSFALPMSRFPFLLPVISSEPFLSFFSCSTYYIANRIIENPLLRE